MPPFHIKIKRAIGTKLKSAPRIEPPQATLSSSWTWSGVVQVSIAVTLVFVVTSAAFFLGPQNNNNRVGVTVEPLRSEDLLRNEPPRRESPFSQSGASLDQGSIPYPSQPPPESPSGASLDQGSLRGPPANVVVDNDDAPEIPFTGYSACLNEMRVENQKWTCPTTGAIWKTYNTKPETLELIAAAGGESPTMRTFMNTYEGESWGCGSGHGSSIDLAARTICNLASMLPGLMNVTLLIDFPCGDQQWAPHLRHRLPKHIKYLGVDAMPGVVQRNRELFSAPGRVEFLLAELGGKNVFDVIKAGSALWQPDDRVAVLSRHVLEHNTYATDAQYIRALRVSGAEYYIGTSVFGVDNQNGQSNLLGGAYGIDFHAKPWNWRRGIATWQETFLEYDAGGTLMEVWQVATLPDPVGI